MKASEMREMTRDELMDKENELSQQLFALRLQKVTGQLENPSKIPQARRDLARVLTVLRERQDGQDGHRGGRAHLYASALSPLRETDLEVRGSRRDQPMWRRRSCADRGHAAALEAQTLAGARDHRAREVR